MKEQSCFQIGFLLKKKFSGECGSFFCEVIDAFYSKFFKSVLGFRAIPIVNIFTCLLRCPKIMDSVGSPFGKIICWLPPPPPPRVGAPSYVEVLIHPCNPNTLKSKHFWCSRSCLCAAFTLDM